MRTSRPWQLYETVFGQLLARCQQLAGEGQRKFPFKNKLVSLDATVIDLCLTLYDWAQFRRTKEPSSGICCWITMAICPALPA
jgi:hypothetical protein